MTNEEVKRYELDWQIAEVLDLEVCREKEWPAVYLSIAGDNEHSYVDGKPIWAFRPSTDWNDAMFAAENYYAVDSLKVQRDKNLEWDARIGGETAHAETGPLAICKAILSLKESV